MSSKLIPHFRIVASPLLHVVLVSGLLLAGCTHGSLEQTEKAQEEARIQANHSACAHTDWFEVGRADGANGARLSKAAEYETRCEGSRHHFDSDYYVAGRNAGLIEYCTPTVAFDSGRSGLSYDHVCPSYMEKSFLESYAIGQRARQLDTDNIDLQSRIENLAHLISPREPANSMKAQIEQLKQRRAQNESEIDRLQSRAARPSLTVQ